MALGLFTLADIRQKVRNLTGHKTEDDLSNDDLDKYINRYYCITFPLEVRPNELMTWFEFDTVASQDEYDLDTIGFYEDFISLDHPAFVDSYDLNFFLDADDFYSKWPLSSTYDDGLPEDVLFYDRMLTFRNPPDDIYTVKIAAWQRPPIFYDLDPIVKAGLTPIVEEWGHIISYGAAREIAEDYGDFTLLQQLEPFYQKHKSNLTNKVHFQNNNVRSVPKF